MISMLSVRVVLMATVAAAIYHGHKTKTLAIYRSFAHFGEINYPDSLCGGVLITWKYLYLHLCIGKDVHVLT